MHLWILPWDLRIHWNSRKTTDSRPYCSQIIIVTSVERKLSMARYGMVSQFQQGEISRSHGSFTCLMYFHCTLSHQAKLMHPMEPIVWCLHLSCSCNTISANFNITICSIQRLYLSLRWYIVKLYTYSSGCH